jgi:hypothetical protein
LTSRQQASGSQNGFSTALDNLLEALSPEAA